MLKKLAWAGVRKSYGWGLTSSKVNREIVPADQINKTNIINMTLYLSKIKQIFYGKVKMHLHSISNRTYNHRTFNISRTQEAVEKRLNLSSIYAFDQIIGVRYQEWIVLRIEYQISPKLSPPHPSSSSLINPHKPSLPLRKKLKLSPNTNSFPQSLDLI